MGRAADADPCICDHINNCRFARGKAMARICAEIELMVSIRYVERLSQFARSRTKPVKVIDSASLFHQRNSAARFDRADQDQSIAWSTFYQHV